MNTQEFLDTKLGDLLTNLKTAAVIATTKNGVGGMYEYIDPIECPEGLSVRIFSGHNVVPREFQTALIRTYAFDTEPYSQERLRAMSRSEELVAGFQNATTLCKANEELSHLEETDEIFLVSYVSYHGLGECVQSLRTLKIGNPNIKVIATACDCDARQKRDIFQPLIESGEVVDLIIEPMCGGIQSMQMLLDGFIEQWPKRNRS